MAESEWTFVDQASPAERLELDDLELLSEVTNPIRGRILRRLRLPHSVAELAEQLDVPVTRLYHHVNRLEAGGLVRVVATRRVGAATERRYQVVARSFQIAPRLFDELEPRDLAVAMGGLFDLAKLGLQRLLETGELRASDLDERGMLTLAEFRLRPERRVELVQRLKDLVAEFAADDDGAPMTLFVTAYDEPA